VLRRTYTPTRRSTDRITRLVAVAVDGQSLDIGIRRVGLLLRQRLVVIAVVQLTAADHAVDDAGVDYAGLSDTGTKVYAFAVRNRGRTRKTVDRNA